MYKEKGYDAEHNDWFWAKYTPDGKVDAEGKVKACYDCHGQRKDNDYIWTGEIKMMEGSRIDVQVDNLDPLDKGHYEGWVISGGKKISSGNFNVNKQKQLFHLSGKVIYEFKTGEKVEKAEAFAISIEPDSDSDPNPSGTIILFGKAQDNRANLAFEAVDFNKLSGRYILATPTMNQTRMKPREFGLSIPPKLLI